MLILGEVSVVFERASFCRLSEKKLDWERILASGSSFFQTQLTRPLSSKSRPDSVSGQGRGGILVPLSLDDSAFSFSCIDSGESSIPWWDNQERQGYLL